MVEAKSAKEKKTLKMKVKRTSLALALTAIGLLYLAATATAAPILDMKTNWGSTTMAPDATGLIALNLRNVGDEALKGATLTVTDELPPGITWVPHQPLDPQYVAAGGGGDTLGIDGAPWNCVGSSGNSVVTCTATEVFAGAQSFPFTERNRVTLRVHADAEATGGENVAIVSSPGAVSGTDIDQVAISETPPSFGLIPGSVKAGTGLFDKRFPAGEAEQHAGEHPYEMRINFDYNMRTEPGHGYIEGSNSVTYDPENPLPLVSTPLRMTPVENVRTLETTLPRGLIGNPESLPKCSDEDYLLIRGKEPKTGLTGTDCPSDTQVGYINVWVENGGGQPFWPFFGFGPSQRIPVFNLNPPKGTPADFGFVVGPYHGHIYAALDPAQGYRIKAITANISSILPIRAVQFTMWGVPGDPRHDIDRNCPSTSSCAGQDNEADYGGSFGQTPVHPLLTLPMACGDAGAFQMRTESWQHQGYLTPKEDSEDLNVDGCDDPRIRFEPDIRLQPTTRDAGGPTGLDVHLEVPQRDDQVLDPKELYEQNGDVQAIPTPPMKKVVVTFPPGMTISTSAAQGLGNCSAAQIGIGTNSPVTCPDNSRYGSITLHTPILPSDAPMFGDIYIAKQNDNPFGNFLSMYFVIHDEERGLLVKVAGKIELDPQTGQIKTTFDDLPQFPISDMQLTFKGGVRAALVNPSTCGTKTITADFYSWSDPGTPHTVTSSYPVTKKPNGSPCVQGLGERPFKPQLSAGTVSNAAGAYSPFHFRLTRTDDDQEFSQLAVSLPPGMSGKLAGIGRCPQAQITAAAAASRTGTEELHSPSCPASSQIGTSEVGSGVGVPLFYIPGKVYLAGPYRGSPLSMVVISPILAGPYDLGVIAVQSAIHVDPQSAQVSVKTDPFPQIYQGIPVRIRDIRVSVDRPQAILNPTSCDPKQITAHVTGTGGDVNSIADDTQADASTGFQAASCASLPFKPKLSFKLKGGTKRGDFPALIATLRARPGDANIARSSVILPRTEFIEQGHIRTVCTRVQYAAKACPPGSVYGYAKAWTPLLDQPLQGPVYLRSNGGERLLPDLVASLDGDFHVDLAGHIDSLGGRIRNIFEAIPDAPVTKFTLHMQGGKKGLLVNHLDLCEVSGKADVRFAAHNGKLLHFHPTMGTSCAGKAGKAKRQKHNRQAREAR